MTTHVAQTDEADSREASFSFATCNEIKNGSKFLAASEYISYKIKEKEQPVATQTINFIDEVKELIVKMLVSQCVLRKLRIIIKF